MRIVWFLPAPVGASRRGFSFQVLGALFSFTACAFVALPVVSSPWRTRVSTSAARTRRDRPNRTNPITFRARSLRAWTSLIARRSANIRTDKSCSVISLDLLVGFDLSGHILKDSGSTHPLLRLWPQVGAPRVLTR